MLRFAPSPTRDLDIENLRIALFNYILSVQKNEDLVVRIEDTDQEQAPEGKDKEIVGLLDLFGIKYKDVLYQSSYLKYHRAMALQLLHEKIAFNCFCSPETLEAKQQQAKAEGKTYRYDDACLSLRPEETIDNESPFTVRLRKPTVNVAFTDVIKGELSFSPEDIDSFVIMKADKNPTYDFACAVDDMISDISMVVRSEEYLSNTPRQIAVRAALNYTKEIEYVHVPVMVDTNGEKVDRQAKALNVKWLLEEGFLPAAIVNYLLLLGNTPPQETFTLEEAVKWFDLSKVSAEPVTFDSNRLRAINRQHLLNLDDVELSRYVGFADEEIGKLAKVYLQDLSTTKELREKISPIFASKVIPDDCAEAVARIREVLKDAPFFEAFDDFRSYLVKESEVDGKELSDSLRILLCGTTEDGPALDVIYPLIKNYLTEVVK